MAPDLERLTRTPCPIARCASFGTRTHPQPKKAAGTKKDTDATASTRRLAEFQIRAARAISDGAPKI